MKDMAITSLDNLLTDFTARLRDYELQMAKIGDRHSELTNCRNQVEKVRNGLAAAQAAQDARDEEKK